MGLPSANLTARDVRGPFFSLSRQCNVAAVIYWDFYGVVLVADVGAVPVAKSRNRPAVRQKTRAASAGSDALFEQARSHLLQGKPVLAEAVCRHIIEADPAHVDALQLLGVIEFQSGNFAAAAGLLQRAVRRAPEAAGLHCNLGLALQALGRMDEALASYNRALVLKPEFAEAHNNRGNLLMEMQRPDEALASYRRAVQLRPDFAEAQFNLGRLLLDRQPPQEALAAFDRALQAGPDNAEAHFWRGNALLELARPEEAAASYRRSLQLRPDIAETHYNLANTLLDLGRYKEALTAYDHALKLRPDYVEALYNLSSALQELGRHADAIPGYERLLQVAPGHRYAPGKLFHCRQFCCDWARHAEDAETLLLSMDGDKAHDMPFPFLAVVDDPARQLRCARAYTARKYPASPARAGPGWPHRNDRIRLAYVSADFREHAVSYLLAGVFEAHDRGRFETIAISLRPPDGSALGQRVAAAFGRFVDASRLSDAEVAALMRELEVDIAVDLTGYTDENRTAIFALRPAPIQLNYLGFPGTMGADYIDYIIADEFVIPQPARRHYTERVVYLPDCFQGNDNRRAIAPDAPGRVEAGLPEQGFVFCAFNNLHKFNPPLFDVWMRLLRTVPGSVLWIVADAPVVRQNLAAEAGRRGVGAQRLVFAPRIDYAQHLARLRLADLFLDTLPFNAGTTASDALWAGLPVLTCAGESFAARMAGSLVTAVGLPELITRDMGEYEALALKLATTPDLLADIRSRLARNRTSAPLFDTARFTRHLEAAYLTMHERRQRGEAPVAFSVAPVGECFIPAEENRRWRDGNPGLP